MAVHCRARTFAVDNELIAAVGFETIDHKALLAVDGLYCVALDWHAYYGTCAFGKTGTSVFYSHAVGAEISPCGVPT